MTTNIKKLPELLVSDHCGVYTPQIFCKTYAAYITNMQDVKEDFDICLSGTDHPEYWEAWDNLIGNIKFTNDNKESYYIGYLMESGDLWAIPEGYEYNEDNNF